VDAARTRGLAKRCLQLSAPNSQDSELVDQLNGALQRYAPNGPAAVVLAAGSLLQAIELSAVSHQILVIGDDAMFSFAGLPDVPSISMIRVPYDRFGMIQIQVNETLDRATQAIQQVWHFRGKRDSAPLVTLAFNLQPDHSAAHGHGDTLAVAHALATRLGWAIGAGSQPAGVPLRDDGYQKLLEQLQSIKKNIADLATAKKRLQLQDSSMQRNLVALDTQASQALAAGQEDLARTTLERKQHMHTELQSLNQQVNELDALQQQLTDSEQMLRAQIDALRTKTMVSNARHSAAAALMHISAAAAGVGEQIADASPSPPSASR
jgi:hypothetical protein